MWCVGVVGYDFEGLSVNSATGKSRDKRRFSKIVGEDVECEGAKLSGYKLRKKETRLWVKIQ